MTRLAIYGAAQGLDGRDAAMKATQKALDQLGALRPVLGIAIVSEEFDVQEALLGLSSLVGDTPLWGISTVMPIQGGADLPRSVVVVLLAGNDLKAVVHWLPNFAEDSQEAARQVSRLLRQELILPQGVLLAAEGVGGSLLPACSSIADLPIPVAGCLASGGYTSGKTYLIGKNQSGPMAMTAAVLGGRFRLSSAVGHGWRDTGLHFTVTKAHDVWVDTLDGAPAAEMYERNFGHTAREWAFPPLSDLTRLYPLGVEVQPGSPELMLRSPLRAEVDGRLRMSAPVAEGSVVHLMLGDPQACLKSAEEAVYRAIEGLNGARPLAALGFIDLAWQYLFETRVNEVPEAIQEALGSIPLVGAYTLGQVARPTLQGAPVIYNQCAQIVLIGCTD